MTKTELQTALIVAGWEKDNNDYWSTNKLADLYDFTFEISTFKSVECKSVVRFNYSDCRLIEVPMKDGTTYRAIVCDIDGLFLRIEL